MWELSNRTRFAAARSAARDRDGADVLLVVVKATFEIGQDNSLRVADDQLPIETVPRHSGDPGRSSLLYDSDFALTKAATDVLLVGHAHAPRGEPAAAVDVRVRVGAWQKRVLCVGDRRWDRGLSGMWLTEPEPFASMPLTYERAFGGVDDSESAAEGSLAEPRGEYERARCDANPVGTGFARSARALVGRAAPNLEDPSELLSSPDQSPRPMSFGPIAREWPLRRRLAGTFDERWRRERRPLVPEDFDDAFWQSAPPDQRVVLHGGEDVELSGVSPRGALGFVLPRLRFSFRSRLEGKVVEHGSSLHSVLFLPDQERVVLVYQSALPCHHAFESLKRTVVDEIASAA